MILLDTDTCVEILRGNPVVLRRRAENRLSEAAVSFMTAAELFYGAERSAFPEGNVRLVESFLLATPIIQSETAILRRFGRIKAVLKRDGELIPDADIFIAATALEKADVLVTGNGRHFGRIDGLKVTNWIR